MASNSAPSTATASAAEFAATHEQQQQQLEEKAASPKSGTFVDFLALTKEGADLYRCDYGDVAGEKTPLQSFQGVEQAFWMAEGQKLLLCGRNDANVVKIYSLETGETELSIKGETPVQRVALSPLQTYIIVCYRYHETRQPQNVCMYTAKTGEKVLSFTLKNFSSSTWPPLRWSSLETCCCRMVPGEALHVFTENQFDFYHPAVRMRCEGLANLSLCNERKTTLKQPAKFTPPPAAASATACSTQPPLSFSEKRESADACKELVEDAHNVVSNSACKDACEKAFSKSETSCSSRDVQEEALAVHAAGAVVVAEVENKAESGVVCTVYIGGSKKGGPSAIKLLKLPEGQCLGSKSFYHYGESAFFWSYDGRAVLAQVHSDATDKSYYGSDALFFFKSDGTYSCQLIPAEEGPIQDVRWSPSTLEFLVCKGPTPPEVLLYDGSKKVFAPKLSFGHLMSNTLRWDPFARIILAAGFGNMAGEVSLWHKAQRKVIARTSAPFSVSCDFTPEGLHFITATTSPRLRVDNRISIFDVKGQRLQKLDFECLYSVLVRPVKAAELPLLQQQQQKLLQQLLTAEPHTLPENGGQKSADSTEVVKKQLYRPPNAAAAWENRMRTERQATLNQSGSVAVVGARGTRGTSATNAPPGYSPAPLAQVQGNKSIKNQKRKK